MRVQREQIYCDRQSGSALPAGVIDPRKRNDYDFRLPAETKLYHFLARRSLPGAQECLNQRTFSAHNHLRKGFEPFALRNFWVGREPIGELTDLTGGNFSFSDSIEQTVQQSRRKVLPTNLRHFFVR